MDINIDRLVILGIASAIIGALAVGAVQSITEPLQFDLPKQAAIATEETGPLDDGWSEEQIAELMCASNDLVVKVGNIYSSTAGTASKAVVGGAGVLDLAKIPVKVANGGELVHWF